MMYYSIDHPDPVDSFTVAVISVNIVGPGENASKTFLSKPAIYIDKSRYFNKTYNTCIAISA